MIAEAVEVQFERFRFDKEAGGNIVDHQMGEIRLTGDGAERGEFGGGETRDIICPGMRIWHAIENRLFRRSGNLGAPPELQ